ncbi:MULTISPECIES: LLM class flavin-dependent oxidoreductase [Rhodococcus]|jgi:alkanesulfonate monooxygenase SsuD/methylene tetrahydromethanopterin reductase-like flavin-dependent oxidoreductase (luciferase family)|uniref:LLM class flavin-dependent oxidoreductase n=1 Tax=Rhodococcus oxybenzonivorans TaxID=1990687 RepID=A0AAE5A8I5_9NOCA|nr:MULTISPECIES: LLM class flavin-dependent oxidoreductase [Rhodococcus]MDV7240662.1 LLM class flavin-dependent oxidoreductase [Rhodococcus oxybenzonivorans]MDV7267218.1 LLM class flavin-dependent oxidoreductase [Rhodococcus oxybenzonivorans]MDV7272935.1 LLM class flavin-dependent oxidoreductase [Rhodococcus oxybenzonivorans]MDV7333326.1 LLM class flavin-dependent oxidoreductase [Rhodococcus oxybenzonivorans]MDV7342493.1 LLM class flavin-dependent oxidoreductase [Rhodococcus oxybenzonivorans]
MKFLLMTLVTHQPDPVTGEKVDTATRLREVVDSAVLAEQLGYDGFAVGERHEHPFLSSAPPVVLSAIAARTTTLQLWTAVTTLSLLDPVRAFEDYSTLDNLSGGRLQLIIGKGNGTAQAELFSVTPDDQWDRNREGYELFRQLWESEDVTWQGSFRPRLEHAVALPRPLQPRIRIWHGSATSRESVDLAARYGDPLFSANVTNPVEPYAELIRHYRERWIDYGHDPADALVGAGTAGFYVTPKSQDAVDTWRPIHAARIEFARRTGLPVVFDTVEDFVERSSALIGSPEQVIDKVARYHEQFGHEVIHLGADRVGTSDKQHRESLELFQAEVAPALRATIPSRSLTTLPCT